MENAAMDLGPRQLEQVGDYVRTHLSEWMGEYDMVLRERVIRVEESIRSQQELMRQGFEQMEKRFEQVDKRFEQVDKHFAEQRQDFNARFDRTDRRFNLMFSMMSGLILTCLAGFITLIINIG